MRTQCFLLLFCTISFACAHARAASCKEGNCVLLVECEPILNLLKQRSLARSTSLYLHSVRCGYKSSIPLVCCVQESATTTMVPRQATQSSDHPNWKPPRRHFTSVAVQLPQSMEHHLNRSTHGHDGASLAIKPSPESMENHPNWKLLPNKICGLVTREQIRGGEEAGLDEFPWLALISHVRKGGEQMFGCGGVLISARYVLTAAHCVHKTSTQGYEPLTVRLGEHNVATNMDCTENPRTRQRYCADPVQDIPIEDIIIFNAYKGTHSNRRHDIALIRLNKVAKMNRHVRPICLPTVDIADRSTKPGIRLTVAGWGQTERGRSSKVKLKTDIPAISNEVCRQKYINSSDHIVRQQVCASSEGRDTCKGDSGGPLMSIASSQLYRHMRYFVIGIVSYGPNNCGDGSKPGVYTRVSSYMPWILNTLKT